MPSELSRITAPSARHRTAIGALMLAALAVPVTLLCDYSWESTIGIDRLWAWPHVANYLAILIAAGAALAVTKCGSDSETHAVRIGRWHAPLGVWIVWWGGLAFVTAVIFDRWWQGNYGLIAGIWHPPQLLKAAAFGAVLGGAWMLSLPHGAMAVSLAGAGILGFASLLALPLMFANRQHDALFYQVSAAMYPVLLVAAAGTGTSRWAATRAALIYTGCFAACVWLLPLIPGAPLAGPIFHPRETLLPPPFPLLLVLPALAIDILARSLPTKPRGLDQWAKAAELGLAFTLLFIVAQWTFSAFLLSPGAEGAVFAGGGKNWPFFLQITPAAQTSFWESPARDLDAASGIGVAVIAIVSARIGLAAGRFLRSLP